MFHPDRQYQKLPFGLSELDHAYGPNVHILSSPIQMSLLARACASSTTQPTANNLFHELYVDLLNNVINHEFPRREGRVESRMIAATEQGIYAGEILDDATKVVVAMVARAGILPSQIVYDRLNLFLRPEGVRLDCFFVSRATDHGQRVIGANVASHKIGGDLNDRILLLPDPMGATGSSIVQTIETYRSEGLGLPKKIIAIHLIVTPEYIRKVTESHPEMTIYAVRLDRGLSPDDVLKTKPGVRWSEERGLTEKHYIVPGGGGIGEVMTNSWV